MVILDIVPLTPLPRNLPQIVSYFHSDPLSRGTVVEILFNKRKVDGIVVGSDTIQNRKLLFKKQSSFTVKPITGISKKSAIPEKSLKLAEEVSKYYLAPIGIVLKVLLSHPELEESDKFSVWKKYISVGKLRAGEAIGEYLPNLVEFKEIKKDIKIVDMRKEIRDANYSIFSRHLKEALQIAQEEKEKTIIFIPRKGYSNFMLCKECGSTISCKNCSASLVLYESLVEPAKLKCHHCSYSEPRPKTCSKCNGYSLKPYGVGIDKVEAELYKFFSYQNLPKPEIAKLSGSSKKIPLNWHILLATQSIFAKKDLIKAKFLGIINADTLIYIPDYKAEEMLLQQTLLLSSMADHTIVQTYNPDDPALVSASKGNIDEFIKEEYTNRKILKYPPHVSLVRLTYRHKYSENAKNEAMALREKLKEVVRQMKVEGYDIEGPYPSFIERENGMSNYNLLLKVASDKDTEERNSILRYVPTYWNIDVDPMNVI